MQGEYTHRDKLILFGNRRDRRPCRNHDPSRLITKCEHGFRERLDLRKDDAEFLELRVEVTEFVGRPEKPDIIVARRPDLATPF